MLTIYNPSWYQWWRYGVQDPLHVTRKCQYLVVVTFITNIMVLNALIVFPMLH